MTEVKKLQESDMERFKPKYVLIPTTWKCGGSQGMTDKKGRPFKMLHYYNDDDVRISFFAEQCGLDEMQRVVVEQVHFDQQVKRGEYWADKAKK